MVRAKPARGVEQDLGVKLARLTWRRLFVRLVALATCLIALAGVGASAYAYQQVGLAERQSQEQLLQISAQFDEISGSIVTVSESIGRAAGTVDEAKTSLGSASATTRGAASTLDETARTINFTIPGTTLRPLAGVDTNFRNQAEQLRTLANDIDRTGGSLTSNAGDLRAIGRDVGEVSRDMDEVAQRLRQFAGGGAEPGGLAQITDGTRLIISWSVIVHILLFGMGIALYLLTTEPRYVIIPATRNGAGNQYDVQDLEAELYGR